jgi:transposase
MLARSSKEQGGRLAGPAGGEAVVELSLRTWLVAGIVPGLERHPLKKLYQPDAAALFLLLQRWREEATKAGRTIKRIAIAFEAGRDGFWLARWLRKQGIEDYVIHPTSVSVSREHRRAKSDRLDTGQLKRAFHGWLRGESDYCRRDPHARAGRCQTTEPRACELGRRAHTRYQSHEGLYGPPRHPWLQPEIAQGSGAACRSAHARG